VPRLADSFALVAPLLPSELVSAATGDALSTVAAALPPIHRAGLECRLAADDDQVDLQQGFLARDGEPRRLATFVSQNETVNGAWDAVRRLAERWDNADDTIHDAIAELWLEHDVGGDVVRPALGELNPSAFAVLAGAGRDRRLSGARAILGTLMQPDQATWLDPVLRRLTDACPHPAAVSHVGLMLGRPVAALRVHASPIPLYALDGFLRRVGLKRGDSRQAVSLAFALLDHGDQLVVCLDIVEGSIVRVGLECFFEQKQGTDPRWRPLLDRLVELGLSSPDKAEALTRWPGHVTPLDAAAPWPQDLIVQSLTQPVGELGVIERRLSHVKLTCGPGSAVTAKAYFGWGHVWVGARETAPRQPRRQPPARPAATAEVALATAVEHLLGMRNQAGWWRDFFDRARPAGVGRRVMGYASDEWVTAFVANALAAIDPGDVAPALATRARTAAGQALALLLHRRSAGGWGYHALLPADADTTTWVLRLARSLDEPERGRLAQARRLVDSLTDADGGVATYAPTAAAPLARFLRMDGSYEGWCSPHTCVTAAAAALDPASSWAAHLRAAQRADGSWTGHWWDDAEYTTARAVEALADSPGDRDAVAAAVGWCADRVGGDGGVSSGAHGGPSAFATALALQAIAVSGVADEPALLAAARAERWLLDHQLEDGSWAPSARLRVPPPDARDPLASPQFTLTYVDDEGAFTTAAAAAALAAARSRPHSASA